MGSIQQADSKRIPGVASAEEKAQIRALFAGGPGDDGPALSPVYGRTFSEDSTVRARARAAGLPDWATAQPPTAAGAPDEEQFDFRRESLRANARSAAESQAREDFRRSEITVGNAAAKAKERAAATQVATWTGGAGGGRGFINPPLAASLPASQQGGSINLAQALGLPPPEKASLLSPGFMDEILSRRPGGTYISASTGDGLTPIQRYLSKNEGLYQSPLGAGLYGVAKVSGASEETARQIGGAGAMVEAVGSIVTIGGSRKASPVQPYGNEKFNTQVDSYINMGKQSRHINDGGASYKGGGYFTDPSQAQDVLNAYQRGEAQIVGRGSDGGHIVVYNSVTGYNNNPRASYANQPTNVFWIKGTNSSSVVPLAPSKGERP